MPDDLTPLAHCTVDQIVEEIDRRTTAFVLVILKDAPAGDHKDAWQSYWRGGALNAVGLAETLAYSIKEYLRMQPQGDDPAEKENGDE